MPLECAAENRDYLKKLQTWKYSLRSCRVDETTFGTLYPIEKLAERGCEARIVKDTLARSRYGTDLAFYVSILVEQKSRYGNRTEVLREIGPLTLLPKTTGTPDEAIVMVLRDLCGVEADLPEPKWVKDYVAPGQKQIDEGMERLRVDVESLVADYQGQEKKRERARLCLQLLYQRGEALEIAAREVLRRLGSHVEDPAEPGKEDGWATYKSKDRVLEGVLEIKSTKSRQFGEDGIRQLLDWINRGVQLREIKYKGIFIGLSSVDNAPDERPWPFSDSWTKSAELHQLVAMRTEDLYSLYVADCEGLLDRELFWSALFSTDGIFDAEPFLRDSERPGGTERKL